MSSVQVSTTITDETLLFPDLHVVYWHHPGEVLDGWNYGQEDTVEVETIHAGGIDITDYYRANKEAMSEIEEYCMNERKAAAFDGGY